MANGKRGRAGRGTRRRSSSTRTSSPARLEAERGRDVADALERLAGLEPFELACVNGARVLLLEALQRGALSRVALLALERALAEIESAQRDLERNDGHGSRRG